MKYFLRMTLGLVLLLMLGACSDESATTDKSKQTEPSSGAATETDSASQQSATEAKQLVVYTSVDQVFSEPILQNFQQESGITVKPVYDIEAAKTVGLVERLIEEKDHPQCDLFWNGETLQTMRLVKEGVVEDKDWQTFGGRGRVFLYDKTAVEKDQLPKTIKELGDADFGKEGLSYAIAYPMFGTTSTHVAMLYGINGAQDTKTLFEAMREHGAMVVDGNSAVKDAVDRGAVAFGLTDTDDALEAMQDNDKLAIAFPDQLEPGDGAMVIPNSVAIIKGSAHEAEARELIDYLLSEDVQKQMVKSGWLSDEVESTKKFDVDWMATFDNYEPSKNDMKEIFAR
uniref:extracellular solute-binding protein n=1 Tax=Ndongobacter massiliensis TaxID=1871025 RepID=UPI0009319E1D|nr:extracellular solute-binding protein [Ndongobacter massiliensis]